MKLSIALMILILSPLSYAYNLSSWLIEIDGDTQLNKLTIPGTHDSGAFITSPLVETQTWTIKQQLNNGIRFLDIRLFDRDGNDFELTHGGYLLGSFNKLVLDEVNKFLDNNPSEFVLMSVKDEATPILVNPNPTFTPNKFKELYLNSPNSKFYQGHPTPTTKIEDLRGKIVIIDRAHLNDSRALNFNRHYIQDEYKLSLKCNFTNACLEIDYGKKWNHVKAHISKYMNDRASNGLWINFTSATWNAAYEKDNAKFVNRHLRDFLKKLKPYDYVGNIFPMDYPEEKPDAIEAMIAMSIRHHASYATPPSQTEEIRLYNSPDYCLHKSGSDSASNGDNVQLWSCNGNKNGIWNKKYISGGFYKLELGATGQCISKKGTDSPSNGDNIHLWNCNSGSSNNNAWELKNGQIKLKGTDYCLQTSSDNFKNGVNIHLWSCKNGDFENKNWLIL